VLQLSIPTVILQSLQVVFSLQTLVIDVLKMLFVDQTVQFALGLHPSVNVMLPAPLLQPPQQHHHHHLPVPHSLFVNASQILNADGANIQRLTPLVQLLLLQFL